MKIKEILQNIDYRSLSVPKGLRHREVLSLCHNSRYATPSCIFFCKVGAVTDGHLYAKNAYLNGARFFVAERALDLPEDAAVILVENADKELKRLALAFYGDPAKDMRLIGITGTKGKTTVALSVYNVARSCGISIGYIGTNGIYYNGKTFETANTTPDTVELQKALREMKDNGVTTVVIEVSSQALWQERIYGLQFEICVFTNLYRDHIGGIEHPTEEHYRSCKKLLFSNYGAKHIVVNADSDASDYMLEGAPCDSVITTSARGNESCDLYASAATMARNGIRPGVGFTCFSGISSSLPIDEHGLDIFLPLPGLYSVENGLLTMAVCRLLGLEDNEIVSALADLRIPGRFETVMLESKPDSLFVIDYAHNGASLRAVLEALRDYEPARIICLFGSVGGRTFERRSELALAADGGADVIIITSDNPDNEDPMHVIDEIYAAIEGTEKPVYRIADRSAAIEKAYELAQPGDFVLLAGKGHEGYQLIMGERVPFSERRILEHTDALSAVH